MKKLAPIKRAERVDSWTTAFLLLMLVHTSVAALSLALEGTVSLLCGVLAAAGYLFGRRWIRQMRMHGRAAVAWTALRVFETIAVTIVVFILGTMIGSFTRVDAPGYVVGGVLSVGFVVYRILTWVRPSVGSESHEQSPQDE